ncbi:hypothetical protein [Mycobacterium sp. 1482292.6]|uniref:hypothetical protein n=1 Tax=Mycobacterium sp. 1482292.6 TaxID=1834081 RepID=UPI0012E9EB9F|nr:hypothetical protein [Mycobacterium sp. 1482292.6]
MASSDNSDSGNSNTNSTPPPDNASAPGQTSNIDNLTQGLKDLQNNGKADVKLSTATRDQYLKIIETYRNALQAERNKMNNQVSLGNPGDLHSANLTKQNLQLDITGLTGAQKSMDKYLAYLDAFEATVNAACNRLIESG